MLAEITTNILSSKIISLIDSKNSIKEWENIFISVGKKIPYLRDFEQQKKQQLITAFSKDNMTKVATDLKNNSIYEFKTNIYKSIYQLLISHDLNEDDSDVYANDFIQKILFVLENKFPNENLKIFLSTWKTELDKNISTLKNRISQIENLVKNSINSFNITAEYLRNHNQFINEKELIENFVNREILYCNPQTTESNKISLEHYFNQLPKLTILEGDAGSGKSAFLMNIHQLMIYEKFEIFLPVVYFNLKYYNTGTLYECIERNISATNKYILTHALLLLDSFDEVSPSLINTLINEIKQIIENSPYDRKVLLSTRTNYNFTSHFQQIDKNYNIIKLLPIKKTNILELIDSNISSQKDKTFLTNFFIKEELSNNIFFVSKILEIYKETNNIPNGVIDLLNKLSEKEVQLITKQDSSNIENFENLALYMTVNQISNITDIQVLKEFNINLNISNFSFSHKNLHEYLAANKIAKQDPKIIMQLITYNSIIPSYLTNTVGYLLNILSQTQAEKFKTILKNLIANKENLLKITSIESDKINPTIVEDIINRILQSNTIFDRFDNIPNYFISFIIKNEYKEKNIDLIIDNIIKNENSHIKQYAIDILLTISTYKDSLSVKQRQKLFSYINILLLVEKEKINQYMIKELLYILSNLELIDIIESNKLLIFCKNIFSKTDLRENINQLCCILLKNKVPYNNTLYFNLFSFIIHNGHSFVIPYEVPSQISDKTYFKAHHIIDWEYYISLTKKYLTTKPYIVWKVIKNIDLDKVKKISHDSSLERLILEYNKAIETEISNDKLNPNKTQLLIKWFNVNAILNKTENLWNILINNCNKIQIIKISKILISNNIEFLIFRPIMDYYINEIITSEKAFISFKRQFYYSKKNNLKLFFERFLSSIEESNPIYQVITDNISKKYKQSMLKRLKLSAHEKNEIYKKEHSKIDYSIAFNKKDLIKQINRLFDHFETKTITRKIYINSYYNKIINYNLFATYLIDEYMRVNNLKELPLHKILNSINCRWEENYIGYLLDFCKIHELDINNFNVYEKTEIKKWCIQIITKYPLDDISLQLFNIHFNLKYILEKATFLHEDIDFKAKIQEQIYNLIFLGASNELFEKFIYTNRIIKYLFDNLDKAIKNSEKHYLDISNAFDYLEKNESIMSLYQKEEFKKILIKYIINHINDENYNYSALKTAKKFNFKITDIPIDILINSFKLNIKQSGLKNNYTLSFFNNISEFDINERQYLLNATKEAFNKAQDVFLKKSLAEYYIVYNPEKISGEIFTYYANYLLNNDKSLINERFSNFDTFLKTAELSHLDLLIKLFKYSYLKAEESERRRAIRSISIASFKEIGENITNQEELDYLIENITILAKNNHGYLYNIISKIQETYIKRNNKFLDIDSILKLTE